MSSAPARPRWWFLITPRWLAWHAFAVLASWGMLWLGDWQFHRAEGGNALSWAYTFEWPIFVIFGIIFWGKTIADEWRTRGRLATSPAGLALSASSTRSAGADGLPAAAHVAAVTDEFDDQDDPELAAYNAYLTRLSNGQRVGRYGSPQPGSTQPSAG